MNEKSRILEEIKVAPGPSIAYVVLDEIHCLSNWGHDFRPEYLMLSKFLNKYLDRVNAFLKGLEKMMDARLAQLSATEKRVEELTQQLEAKYNAFVGKLESTNMDQLYKYCQDMNKSINRKLGIALGGVAIAVIVSIISLFI